MKVFVAASYSSQVDYTTGLVSGGFQAWLESILTTLEGLGHAVFCAQRADGYKINHTDPAGAYRLDMAEIEGCDILLALLDAHISAGLQTEIGAAVAHHKKVILAHEAKDPIGYFNTAMVQAGVVQEIKLPLDTDELQRVLIPV